MKRTPFLINLTQKEEQRLQEIITKPKNEYRLVFRSRIILYSAKGYTNRQISIIMKTTEKTVSKWRCRYRERGLEGLYDKPRSGRPKLFGIEVQYELVHLACSSPDKIIPGLTKWSYRKLCLCLIQTGIVDTISFTRVMTWLKQMDIKPQKVKYWLTQTDPDFNEKMYKIIDLYHNPPKDGPVICVDEKTTIQVLKPLYPDRITQSEQFILREFDYQRKGTLCLIAGFDIGNGKVIGIVREHHKTQDFIDYLKVLRKAYFNEKVIHIVLDNLSVHKSKELKKWLLENKNPFVFHYLPYHGSWLNQIEIWFGILQRECLDNDCSPCKAGKAMLIQDYIDNYNKYFAHPFHWQYGKKLLCA